MTVNLILALILGGYIGGILLAWFAARQIKRRHVCRQVALLDEMRALYLAGVAKMTRLDESGARATLLEIRAHEKVWPSFPMIV